MNKLTCEMCGGTDFVKEEGVLVCQSCGLKYSVEEAKKIMVEGVVKVDRSDDVGRYVAMMMEAYNNHNNAETMQYANRVLEIEPMNAWANLCKGVATIWESTIAYPRIDEASNYFTNAIGYVELGSADAKKIFIDIVSNLNMAISSLKRMIFESISSKEDMDKKLRQIVNYDPVLPKKIIIIEGVYNSRLPKDEVESRGVASWNVNINFNTDIPYEVFEKKFNKIANDCYERLKLCDGSYMSSYIQEGYYYHTSSFLMAYCMGDNQVKCLEYALEAYKKTQRYTKMHSVTTAHIVSTLNDVSSRIEKAKDSQKKKEDRNKERYWEKHEDEKQGLLEEIENVKQQINSIRDEINKESVIRTYNDYKKIISSDIERIANSDKANRKDIIELGKIIDKKNAMEKYSISDVERKYDDRLKPLEAKLAELQSKLPSGEYQPKMDDNKNRLVNRQAVLAKNIKIVPTFKRVSIAMWSVSAFLLVLLVLCINLTSTFYELLQFDLFLGAVLPTTASVAIAMTVLNAIEPKRRARYIKEYYKITNEIKELESK